MKTKNILAIFTLVLFSMFGGQGCSETEDVQKGSIDFGMNPLIESTLKSADVNRYDIVGALISIVGEDGQMVYDKEFLHFYSFGESFVTERLSLEAGKYALTEFLLVDSTRTILWVTPLENSRMANMVDVPLPMKFRISANTTTHLHPQVVWVGDFHPSDFGYVSFDVEFVEKFCIGVYYKSYCYNWYNDSVLGPDNNFAPVILSTLIVKSGEKVIMEAPLMPEFNRIFIPRGFEYYTFIVKDCSEQYCFQQSIKATELHKFACYQENPLIITCEAPTQNIVVTPEDVLEPSIDQGVFGRIFITYYDSTSNGDYEFYPLVRDLYLYKMSEGDSIHNMIRYDACNVYPQTDIAPHMIIRSNSSGFYQSFLEAGNYLYMVLTKNGFYIDMYLSSRLPGLLKIEEGKVTIQNIGIQPCYW